MRGLEKNRMGRGHTRMRTSRLYDRIGPVGRFDEKEEAALDRATREKIKEKVRAKILFICFKALIPASVSVSNSLFIALSFIFSLLFILGCPVYCFSFFFFFFFSVSVFVSVYFVFCFSFTHCSVKFKLSRVRRQLVE